MNDPWTIDELVKKLDAIPGGDPEIAHDAADRIVLGACPRDVQAAYRRVIDRCDWWASA